MQPKVKSVAIYNVLPKEIMTAKTFIFHIIECFLRQKKKKSEKDIFGNVGKFNFKSAKDHSELSSCFLGNVI